MAINIEKIELGDSGEKARNIIYNNDKRIADNVYEKSAVNSLIAKEIENLEKKLNGAIQATNYHFPLICTNSDLTSQDIVLTKKSTTLLTLNFKKDLYFYYKTQVGFANSIYLSSQIIEIPIVAKTSIVIIGVILNTKTARENKDVRYSYVLVPDWDNFAPVTLAENEVFAPILTISGMAKAVPILSNGTVLDNIKSL